MARARRAPPAMTAAPSDHADVPAESRRDAAWLMGRAEAQGFPRYLEAVRAGKWIILAALVACIGAAALYLSRADKVSRLAFAI